jgi:hypothetical protein
LVGTKNSGTKHSDEIMSWAKELGIEKYTMLMKFSVDFSWLICKKNRFKYRLLQSLWALNWNKFRKNKATW